MTASCAGKCNQICTWAHLFVTFHNVIAGKCGLLLRTYLCWVYRMRRTGMEEGWLKIELNNVHYYRWPTIQSLMPSVKQKRSGCCAYYRDWLSSLTNGVVLSRTTPFRPCRAKPHCKKLFFYWFQLVVKRSNLCQTTSERSFLSRKRAQFAVN